MNVPNSSTPSSSKASSSSWLLGDNFSLLGNLGEGGGSEFNGGSFFLLLLLDTELVFCLFCKFLLTFCKGVFFVIGATTAVGGFLFEEELLTNPEDFLSCFLTFVEGFQ